MDTRPLGTDGPQVSVICLGAWPLGGGMGAIPDAQAISTIHAAIDAGMTFIDTAEGYRTSESVLGKALRGRRHETFLATKLSGDHSPEHMTKAIENSLRSLGTEYVDLYQLHSPKPEWPLQETMAGLVKLRDQGKIRYIGVSNFSGDQHREAAQVCEAAGFVPISSSQPRYNMLFREAEEDVLPACLELGIGVIAHSPLAKGILTGKYRPGHQFPDDDERSNHFVFSEGRPDRAWQVVPSLRAWASDHGRDIVQLAIAWTLAHPSMASCIAGAKTPEQVLHNASAADWRISDSEMTELAKILAPVNLG
ncbi:MAG: aldo/keto reductase [Chloroflexi bacterium]|nr:aldo/keto reductase [Chloroflexota bacterium]